MSQVSSSLTPLQRADELLHTMTIEEKAFQISSVLPQSLFGSEGLVEEQLEKQLDLQQADLDDRQKALNDQRMLEGIREDAMDSMRRYFLNNCPAGLNEKSK